MRRVSSASASGRPEVIAGERAQSERQPKGFRSTGPRRYFRLDSVAFQNVKRDLELTARNPRWKAPE